MSVTATPIYPQTLTNTPATFVHADSTTAKTVYTAGNDGSKLEAIYVTNTDTNPYTVNIWIKQSSTSYLLGTVNIPASSGNTTGASPVNLLSPAGVLGVVLNRDSNGNPYLYLSNISSITVAPTTTVTNTSGLQLTFIAQGEDF